MFYCENCRKKNKWPVSFSVSHGPCEMCGKVGDCFDVPCSQLPPSKEEKKTKQVTVIVSYSCPECNYRPWPVGKNRGETHHCLCKDGFWVWEDLTWVWGDQEWMKKKMK